jgi:ankyrin repeat protein
MNIGEHIMTETKNKPEVVELLKQRASQAAEKMTAHITGTFQYESWQDIKNHSVFKAGFISSNDFTQEAYSLLKEDKSFKENLANENADERLILRAAVEAAILTNNVRSIFSLKVDEKNILQLAVDLEDYELLADLLKYQEGRDLTIDYNGEKKTLLQIAFLRRDHNMVRYLLNNISNIEKTKELLRLDGNINSLLQMEFTYNNEEKTLLEIAVLEGDHEMVEYILDTMSSPKREQALCTQDINGNTLLHVALILCGWDGSEAGKEYKTLNVLLKYKENIQGALTKRNNNGETPFYLALEKKLNCSTLLIDKENKVLLEIRTGKSPFNLMDIDLGYYKNNFEKAIKPLSNKEVNEMLLKAVHRDYSWVILELISIALEAEKITEDQKESIVKSMGISVGASTRSGDSYFLMGTTSPAPLHVGDGASMKINSDVTTYEEEPDLGRY